MVQDDFNAIENVFSYFKSHPNQEMIKDACCAYLGRIAQIIFYHKDNHIAISDVWLKENKFIETPLNTYMFLNENRLEVNLDSRLIYFNNQKLHIPFPENRIEFRILFYTLFKKTLNEY